MSAPSAQLEALVAKLDAARRSWFPLPASPDVPAGLRVQLIRPTQVEMINGYRRPPLQMACEQVDSWDGFTEATLLGAEIGSDVPVPFDARLWERWASDHADAALAVYGEVMRQTKAFLDRRAEQSGN